ncbi:MAG TPA: Rieske 2Fe-2S domain-containing protein [Nitrososphaera sp.]|jgi:ferredoxin-NADP reductase/nitrite reductase/ring-hydroxylating ferredoxin subunit
MVANERGYQKVASKSSLKEGGLLRVEPNGKPIVLAMVNGKVYAMDAVCSHEGGPLEDGTLDEYELKCPWHYAIFDVRNGKVSEETVWATDLQSYPVRVDEISGDILVNLEPIGAGATAKQEATVQQPSRTSEKEKQDADAAEKKYYEEEERKARNKVSLELLSKEQLQGTDIMTFRLSRDGIDFSPGQYAFFSLDGLSAPDPKGPIRHFSIASSPTEQDYLMISTRIRDSPYKQKLSSLEKGAKITAWGPQGEFVLHDDYSKPAVFLSGGIGVTPFRSMLRFATDKQLPIKITVFDSNRNPQGILYKEEFDKWAGQNKNLKIIYTITEEDRSQSSQRTTWTGERGRIDKSMLDRHLTDDEIRNAIFYICGPPGMLKAMQELLEKDMQIPKERMKVEAFTGY